MVLKKVCTFVGVFGLSLSALAGGYQLNDYSITGLGRSYAGQGIMGDDYSAIAFNPAGMTLMKKSGMQTGISLINLRADVEGLNERGYSNAGKHKKMDFWAPIPQFFGQYNVNEKWKVGLGVYAPFGLKTQYDSDWFGNTTAILSKLDIIDINGSVAYKMNQNWSFGVSLIARYIYGHMTNKVPDNLSPTKIGWGGGESDFELDGWTKTAAFGLMYEVDDNTRFGLSYRLRSTQQVKGDHTVAGNNVSALNGTYIGRASPALPETLTFSAYHRYKKYGFSGTARWTHWSQSFPEFVMKSDSPLLSTMGGERRSEYNYDNSWTLSAGVDYYYCKNLTFRVGGGWDESPTHNDTTRTIRIPDNDRFWMSTGVSYMKNNWQLDLGYAHMIARNGKALETSAKDNPVPVKYKNMQSHILGVQLQYKF